LTEVSRLEVGAKAPIFNLVNDQGQQVSLTDFKNHKVIIYFYPAAMTPGCSKEACDFNDSLNSFKAAGYTVIGISPDKPAKLAKFRAAESLNFELLSDEDLAVHKTYGAYGEKSLYGRLYQGVLRSTFAVDEKGVIQLAQYNVKATGHVAKLKRDLGLAD
jgi:peroxiredoxin Q/BCP